MQGDARRFAVQKAQFPPLTGDHILVLKGFWETLSFQIQDGIPTLWYLVDSDKEKAEECIFRLVVTGEIIKEDENEVYNYVGTALDSVSGTTYHLFDWYDATPHVLTTKNPSPKETENNG